MLTIATYTVYVLLVFIYAVCVGQGTAGMRDDSSRKILTLLKR